MLLLLPLPPLPPLLWPCAPPNTYCFWSNTKVPYIPLLLLLLLLLLPIAPCAAHHVRWLRRQGPQQASYDQYTAGLSVWVGT